MKRIVFLFLFLFLGFTTVSFSQSSNEGSWFTLRGLVLDKSTKEALDYANIAIYDALNKVVAGSITDNKGHFKLNIPKGGKYKLQISFLGYKPYVSDLKISSNMTLEPVYLEKDENLLHSATVVGKADERKVSVEKTKISMSGTLSTVSSNITDVLKSDPSVTIDNDNNIYLRGNKNIVILLDGRPTSLSSINSIPMSGIDYVEILSSPDVKSDAEGTGGIINIVSKRRYQNGYSSVFQLNYGIQNRVNGNLGFSFKRDKWGLEVGYSIKNENESIESYLKREFYVNGMVASENSATSLRRSLVNGLNSTLFFNLNPKNLIQANVKLMFPSLFTNQNFYTLGRYNDITFSRQTKEGAIVYKHISTPGKRELSTELFFSFTKGSRPANYYDFGILNRKSSGGGHPSVVTLQSDYLSFIGKSRFESGAKISFRWNSFDYKFYKRIGDLWQIDNQFTSDLIHDETISSLYFNLTSPSTLRLTYKIGARGEYSFSNFEQHTTNESFDKDKLSLFPFVSLGYKINSSSNLAITYNRRISRPQYPQLNPFINMIDDMTFEKGNKNLNPELTDKIELAVSSKIGKIDVRNSVYYSYTKDMITQVTMPYSTDKLLLTYNNVDKSIKVGNDFDLSTKVSKWLDLNLAASLYYNDFTISSDVLGVNNRGVGFQNLIRLNIYPDKNMDIQVSHNYVSTQRLPQFVVNPQNVIDLSAKRRFIGGKLAISVAISDLLNSKEWIVNSDNSFFKISNRSKSNSRILWIGMTVNLNSFKIRQKEDKSLSEEGIIKLGY